MNRTRALIPLVMVFLLLPSPASAGGGWWTYIDLEAPYLGIGEAHRADAQLWFETIELAQEARYEGNYYAYLVRDFDSSIVTDAQNADFTPDWWRLGDAVPYRAGTVTFESAKGFGDPSNIIRANVHLEIPEVSAGKYHLMLCDLGCKDPLADVVPSEVKVFSRASEARTARRFADLRGQMRGQRHDLAARIYRVSRESADAAGVEKLEKRVTGLSQEVREIVALSDRVADLEKAREDGGAFPSLLWPLMGILLGALAGVLVARRPARQHDDPEPPWFVTDEAVTAPKDDRSGDLTPVG
jgi:hypothetical protein